MEQVFVKFLERILVDELSIGEIKSIALKIYKEALISEGSKEFSTIKLGGVDYQLKTTDLSRIKGMARNNDFIKAIKELREITRCGLKEAKDYVDEIRSMDATAEDNHAR